MKTIKFKDIDDNECLVNVDSIDYMREDSHRVLVTDDLYERDRTAILTTGKNGPEYTYKKVKDAEYNIVYTTIIGVGSKSWLNFPGRISVLEELIKHA